MKPRGVYEKKSVVITGSTKGLGFELAKDFLQKGMNVTISGRNEAEVADAVSLLAEIKKNASQSGEHEGLAAGKKIGEIQGVVCDVTKPDDHQKMWDAATTRWGRVDVWINNAGMNQPKEFMNDISAQQLATVIDTNLKGTIFGSKVAMTGMLKQGSGGIYNMEGLGSKGEIMDKLNIYTTTKQGITHFTKALAFESEKRGGKVKVGRLSPGMMVTDFILKPVGDDKNHQVDPKTRFIFNVLGDKPDTVARFMTDKILRNEKNNAHIVWLTNAKVMARFVQNTLNGRDLFPKDGKDGKVHNEMSRK